MDLMFSGIECSIILCFKPNETADATILLRALLEEERMKGNSFEIFDEAFFSSFTSSQKKVCVIFNFEHFNLAVHFVEEVIKEATYERVETERFEQFLYQVREWYSGADNILQ